MENHLTDSAQRLERARAGDREALNSLLDRYRDRLRRMVDMRLDTRLQARLDASDVVQEAYVDVAERLEATRSSRCSCGCAWWSASG
jgi:RNA polymerase sigma-70 factor (ECF subfamily)